MRVHIIRGKDQIGGNIIEISTEKTRILLDAGLELDGEDKLPDIQGLFDSAGYDAIFVSHYHSDHLGLVYHANKDIPVYMGEGCYNVIGAADRYKGRETITPKGFLRHRSKTVVGDITVTSYLCDHSAFDSYMLLCEADGEKILYTGDFRSNGRKPFDMLLNSLPTKIDKLICEGTALSRDNYIPKTESELEEEARKLFSEHKGPVFVLQSATNIDRIVTMYRAAKRTGRVFLEYAYMACVAEAAGKHIPNPYFKDVFAFPASPSEYKFIEKYRRKIGREGISEKRFVMCVKTTMGDYLKTLSQKMSFKDGILVYSFWSGYREDEKTKLFLSECQKMGLAIRTLHTSGHADKETIRRLIERVSPTVIIPVHTENAAGFKELAPNIVIDL